MDGGGQIIPHKVGTPHPQLTPPPPDQLSEPNLTPLQQLRSLNRASPEFFDQLNNVLHDKACEESIRNLEGNDLVSVIDYLDKVRCDTSLPRSLLRPM